LVKCYVKLKYNRFRIKGEELKCYVKLKYNRFRIKGEE